jgi:DNA-binding GntR family transcriptional regulator
MVAVIFRGEIAAQEHRALLDCAMRRDIAQATSILATHVDACVDHTLAAGTLPTV